MVLEAIYVVRHGYRSNWVVDPTTGEYSSTVRSPTGIPSDPALASYGLQQAEQLATHLQTVTPPIDLIYSSPFYRCLQTLSPYTNHLATTDPTLQINVEPGVGEFYGLARFDHPSPAPLEVLQTHFSHLATDPIIVPSTKGESLPQLHDRIAYCLRHLIARADQDPKGPKAMLICTHAASMICIGRALTGRMPEDEGEEDFKCFTCSFSKFVRRTKGERESGEEGKEVAAWRSEVPDEVPDVGWRGGAGVGGGWDCEVNGDCSFLKGGEERGWRFSGDESFLKDPNAFNDAANSAGKSVNEVLATTTDPSTTTAATNAGSDDIAGGGARGGTGSRL